MWVFSYMEIWIEIEGYEGLYEVSSLGRVKSLERKVLVERNNSYYILKERILKQNLGGEYLMLSLSKNGKVKNRTVHSLVAEAFLNHKPCGHKLVVNHINAKDPNNKMNNRVDNLEVVTQRKNTDRKHLKSSSQYTGVCWSKSNKKWHAQIVINSKIKHLGYFINELEASNAYKIALNNISY